VPAALPSSNRPPAIVTDAACDIPAAMREKYPIHFLSLRILFGDEVYESGVTITPEEFYARLSQGDVHPSTSQPTRADFIDLYREASADGSPILSVHLSEGLSGTVNVARAAAKELPDVDITVYDSGTLTGALGIQVLTAARAAEAGYTADRIVPLLEREHQHGGMLFSVDDLSYLHRGGRIGSVRYQVGQALRIKPIITVAKTGENAGTYVSAGRARSLAKAADAFVKQIGDEIGPGSKLRAIVLYGDEPSIAQQLVRQLENTFDCVYVDLMPTAAVLGVHVGPKALGIGWGAGDWPV
jgi:DegV family protein with EDD domain